MTIPGLQPTAIASQAMETQQAPRTLPKGASEAAAQFESLLLHELIKVMRKTAPSGSLFGGDNFASEMHTQMFDEQLSQSLSAGKGIGLRAVIERAFGVSDAAVSPPRPPPKELRRAPLFPTVDAPAIAIGAAVPGATGELQRTAASMLADPVAAERWAREGRLGVTELGSSFATEEAAGVARFNVHDAAGFQGSAKCNLFALELARRSGYQVPVIGRSRGWGYPTPDRIAEDAADGRLKRDWARVVTGQSAESLDAAVRSGERAFLLTGSGDGEHAGHMAVVERVHEVHYDDQGQVERVVFDGWEARTKAGAQHLSRRTWNVVGHGGGNLARNGFARIELLELRRAESADGAEIPLSGGAGASGHDAGNIFP